MTILKVEVRGFGSTEQMPLDTLKVQSGMKYLKELNIVVNYVGFQLKIELLK
tara:strand:+ start:194 stop:349 length:156 start_codon:yes stop_codon:yes gene_type:complete